MPENEIPQDVLDQAREAATPARGAVESPTTAEPLDQPVPDVPEDMSNVPDPYDVAGQEAYRADQRAEAVEIRDAEPVAEPEQVSVEEGVNNMSPEDLDAMLEASMTIKDSMDISDVKATEPETTVEDTAPTQDIEIDQSPEPEAPAPDRE